MHATRVLHLYSARIDECLVKVPQRLGRLRLRLKPNERHLSRRPIRRAHNLHIRHLPLRRKVFPQPRLLQVFRHILHTQSTRRHRRFLVAGSVRRRRRRRRRQTAITTSSSHGRPFSPRALERDRFAFAHTHTQSEVESSVRPLLPPAPPVESFRSLHPRRDRCGI